MSEPDFESVLQELKADTIPDAGREILSELAGGERTHTRLVEELGYNRSHVRRMTGFYESQDLIDKQKIEHPDTGNEINLYSLADRYLEEEGEMYAPQLSED